MPPKVYRQGDVVLVEVGNIEVSSDLDDWEERLEIKSETGHAHVLNAQVCRVAGETYVVLEKPEVLEHPQHRPLTIQPGVYRVQTVRSFDKSTFRYRRVMD